MQRSLHSPGFHFGLCPHYTLGIRRQKRIELRWSGTNRSSIGALALGLCRPYGAQNVYQCLTQGLRPGLCRSIALIGLIYVFTTNQLLSCFDALIPPKHHLRDTVGRSQYACALTCKHFSKYDVNTFISTRTYTREYEVLISVSARKYFCGALQNAVIARH